MFIGAKDEGDGGDNCSYKTCKVPVKSSPLTFLQAGCTSCCPTKSQSTEGRASHTQLMSNYFSLWGLHNSSCPRPGISSWTQLQEFFPRDPICSESYCFPNIASTSAVMCSVMVWLTVRVCTCHNRYLGLVLSFTESRFHHCELKQLFHHFTRL